MGCDAPTDPTCTGFADEAPQHSATVASFALDTFLVTVGRFRAFVDAYTGPPPVADAGTADAGNADAGAADAAAADAAAADAAAGDAGAADAGAADAGAADAGAADAGAGTAGTGWDPSWNSLLPATQADLIQGLQGTGCNYQPMAGSTENAAMNCVTWYEAFAFCLWDKGRLATEAEWEYAAVGGSANVRPYPWGSQDPSQTPNLALANDSYSNGTDPTQPVGSHPSGNAFWGHADMAGGMWEWLFDWYDPNWYPTIVDAGGGCSDCANSTSNPAGVRVLRGGSWHGADIKVMRTAFRNSGVPASQNNVVGFRCARSP
jgi:formylglycine-generating enzyme required for sulfatase activity